MAAMLQAMQCSYGATLAAGDRTVLRVLLLVDDVLRTAETWSMQQGSGHMRMDTDDDEAVPSDEGGTADDKDDLLARRMAGPLARSGFLWGRAAVQYYSGLEGVLAAVAAQAVSEEDPSEQAEAVESALKRYRSTMLQDNWGLVEVQRSAAACVHFPDLRTLAADEDKVAYGSSASTSVSSASAPAPPAGGSEQAPGTTGPASASEAAYDPAYVLLFALAHAREDAGGGSVGVLCRWGLCALALRGLGSKDVGLRCVRLPAWPAWPRGSTVQCSGVQCSGVRTVGEGRAVSDDAAVRLSTRYQPDATAAAGALGSHACMHA